MMSKLVEVNQIRVLEESRESNKIRELGDTISSAFRTVHTKASSVLNSKRIGIGSTGFVATVAVTALLGAGVGAVAVGIDTGRTGAVAEWTVTNGGFWSGFWKAFYFGAEWGAITGGVVGALGGVVVALRD